MALLRILLIVVTATVINADDCPGGKMRCPDKMTCCPLSSGSGDFGCCPFSEAICCKDGKHCCPHGLVCDLKHQGCRIGGTDILLDWSAPLQAEVLEPVEQPRSSKHESGFKDTNHIHFTRVVQHENEDTNDVVYREYTKENSKKEHISETEVAESLGMQDNGRCPDGHYCFLETCCKMQSGSYGCCPHLYATCCDDLVHCCPHGYQCGTGGCVRDRTVPWGTTLLKPKALIAHTMEDKGEIQSKHDSQHDSLYKEDTIENIENNKVSAKEEQASEADLYKSLGRRVNGFCKDGSFCPLFWTCCKNQQGGYGCCNHAWATCCDDGLHCCPHGYSCGTSSCVKDKTASWGIPFGYGRFHDKKHYEPKVKLLH
ncbi:unnamed protein product [Meganyctiphanes norvegica]|uniref:Granulins domain-containing protein n=1 Tax=Meganyctiphanes norvegica TaxID=48144 RepID=A0AAV2PWT4_MEGNR